MEIKINSQEFELIKQLVAKEVAEQEKNNSFNASGLLSKLSKKITQGDTRGKK